MPADAWPGTSVVTAGSNRSSLWNIPGCAVSQAGRVGRIETLEQKRQAGLWPPSFDRIWEAFMERHGKQSGTKQMIDLLKLSRKHGQRKLEEAIESALASSFYDSAAVQHLLNAEDLRHTACKAIDLGGLERYARPLPVMHQYDRLLTGGAAQ